jgi:hypothetical protein
MSGVLLPRCQQQGKSALPHPYWLVEYRALQFERVRIGLDNYLIDSGIRVATLRSEAPVLCDTRPACQQYGKAVWRIASKAAMPREAGFDWTRRVHSRERRV